MEWLPRYAPELNVIYSTSQDFKRHDLDHRTFRDKHELDLAIHQAVVNLNQERSHMSPCQNLSMLGRLAPAPGQGHGGAQLPVSGGMARNMPAASGAAAIPLVPLSGSSAGGMVECAMPAL